MFQSDEYHLYSINETIKDLIRCLEEAYLKDKDIITGGFFIEFDKLVTQIKQGNMGYISHMTMHFPNGIILKILTLLKLK